MSPATTSTRHAHARRIVRLVHEGGADTRQAIAAVTGMSPSVVSRATAELLRTRVLEARAEERGDRRGRPTDRLAVHAAAGRTIGVEVARDRLVFVACDARGAVGDAWEAEHEGAGVSVAALARVAEHLAAREGRTRDPRPLLGVGVALHDVVTAEGGWFRADAPAGLVQAQCVLAEHLGVPVVVEDVARAFADAERRLGAGRDAPDMLYLFLGRDAIGSGIFAAGTPLRSSSGISGELGHVRVVDDGRRCSCGNRGCLETVATHEALLHEMRSHLDLGVPSALPPDAGMDAFLRAAREGDETATRVLHGLAIHLRDALTGAIAITGATTVVLGGDVRASGPALPRRLEEELRRAVLPPLAARIDVRYARLPRNAGAHGVAFAVLDEAIRSGRIVDVHTKREEAAM